MIRSNEYNLIKLSISSKESIHTLYNWNCIEENREYFTCRPVKAIESYDDYLKNIEKLINNGIKIYILESKFDSSIIGKITLFDYNPRNRSAEFGYYVPKSNRKNGFGKIILSLFLETAFNDEELMLHKLYATTASGNKGSIKLLENNNFKLDGIIRDHYWIAETVQDQLHYSLLKKEWII